LISACSVRPPSARPSEQTAPVETGVAVAQPASTAVSATPMTPPRAPILRLPLTEPMTIDPGLAEDSNSVEIVSQLFEGLVSYDQNGNAIGLGAEQWSTSGDGLTYTFTLRKGPSWSDGRPVTAQDYAWAWKRNVSPRTASPFASLLFPIKNAQAINEAKLEPEQLGVQAKNDRTLVVTLEKPAAYFLRLAATWPLMPLRRDVLEKLGEHWTEPGNVVSNGPFRLAEWQHDAQLVLERNDRYWGRRPALRQAVFRIYPAGASEQVFA